MTTLQEIKQHAQLLTELCKKYNVLEMYYFYPEKEGGLAYLGDAHFLVLPQKSRMNEFDLHALTKEIGEAIKGIAFVQTEKGMATFLERHMVTQLEYETAIRKDILLFSANVQQVNKSDELLQKKTQPMDKSSLSHSPFFYNVDNASGEEKKSQQNQQDIEVMNICQDITKLSLDQIKALLVEIKKIELSKNLIQNSSFRKIE